jgi:hypothetical protein
MNSPNSHIEDFLNYYCALKSPPEYAVLLKGKWGCGKTWFIKKYCEKLKADGQNYLYVSLYGITSYSEIENLFFQQLHPVLSSKGMSLVSKILKGLIKTSIKIDLDGDNKPDASVNSQVPDINLPEHFKSADGNILIFDDLERCGIEKQDILGYINYFVEHQGFKVIIIANEDDIISKDKSETLYINIKEKLIGKTFEIISDIDEVLDNLSSLIENDTTKDEIKDNLNIIKETYLAADYQNLRHLKQSLWDFERLFSVLPDNITSNKEFNKDLLQRFLSYSFEIKSGAILPTELKKFASGYLDGIFKDKNKEKSKYKILTEKYSNITFYDHIFELSAWELFFDKGIIDKEIILESLKKNRHFQDENTPNWVKLWHFRDLEDNEFSELYEIVSQEIANKEHKEIGIIKHIIGLFIAFSDLGLINETKEVIIENAKKYIDYMKSNNLLSQLNSNPFSTFDDDTWGGLGFAGKDLSEFKEFNEYIAEKEAEIKTESMPNAVKSLLENMVSDTRKFYAQLVHDSDEDNLYYEMPILKYIDPENFVAEFEKLSPENKRTVSYALSGRYKHSIFLEKIHEEITWLEQIKSILSKKQQLLSGKVSGYIIKSTVNEYIDKSIRVLQKYRKQANKTNSADANSRAADL